jgi:hypothetical protein
MNFHRRQAQLKTVSVLVEAPVQVREQLLAVVIMDLKVALAVM